MKKSLIFLISAIVLTGCTITQEFRFNADFSGISMTSIDISLLKNIPSDSTNSRKETDSMFFEIEKAAGRLNEIQGIKVTEYGYTSDSNQIVLNYTFSNLETLNNSLKGDISSSLNSQSLSSHAWFEQKGKKITYHFPTYNAEPSKTEEMDQMADYFTYNLNLYFAKEIKKVKPSNFKIMDEKSGASFTCSLFDFLKKDFTKQLEIKLK